MIDFKFYKHLDKIVTYTDVYLLKQFLLRVLKHPKDSETICIPIITPTMRLTALNNPTSLLSSNLSSDADFFDNVSALLLVCNAVLRPARVLPDFFTLSCVNDCGKD
ncbi:hypothetical protein C0J52_12259 [Blattella germanica]|nr:hypothetical protein C0J52_12259 [Blattella germanica]